MNEQFGISYPQQVIDFDCSAPVLQDESYMVGPEGEEVPFQVLANGHIAVRTDLPPFARKTWKLYHGRRSGRFRATVQLQAQPATYEVTNGITGVRVVRPDPAQNGRLAPIQGVLLTNGTWTATGPNRIFAPGAKMPLAALTATSKILESGPLQVTIQVDYSYNRGALIYGDRVLIPAGAGFYRSTITLQAGSPSVLVREDTDMDLRYSLNLYKEVEPDQGRYRAHHATQIEFGRQADGTLYSSWEQRPPMDAFRDFRYDVPIASSYVTENSNGGASLRRMPLWNPWIFDSGWYWMIYNRNAGGTAPVVGIFPGPASLLLAAHDSGPGLYFSPGGAGGERSAGIELQTNRRGPDAIVAPHIRFAWGLFVGSKEQDLGPPAAVQNIAREMNLHGGINLNKVYRYQTSYPDPPAGTRPLFLPQSAFQSLLNRVRTDFAYYRSLFDREPSVRPMLEIWRDPSAANVAQQVDAITQLARSMLNALIHGDGIYDPRYHYWHGGLAMDSAAVVINSLLVSTPLSERQRGALKAAQAAFAYILWDDDFVPLFRGAAVNLGTANMPVQQWQYRNLYVLALPAHPMMKARMAALARDVEGAFATEINAWGAQRASPHYAEAAMEPLLEVAQGLKASGTVDLFRQQPLIAKFAEFYMNLLTPPEIRFGGLRKLVSIGDGSTESSVIFGELATGLADVDPALSARLMSAWKDSGQKQSGFHGSTVLKIDDALPAGRLTLGSAGFPGWCSVLRSGFGTPQESAVWLIDGTFYSDHRHEDNGSVTFYALGAPISVDWGSMYSPQTAGPYMHSAVLPEAAIGAPWDSDDFPLTTGHSPWPKSRQESFLDFAQSSHATAVMEGGPGMVWVRSVQLIHPDDAHPMILVSDRFSGANSAGNKVLTWNLMGQDTVTTAKGAILPPQRLYEYSGARKELPSRTAPEAIPAGLQRFQFKGQWGVDFDVYTESPANGQYLLGSWAHESHPDFETNAFLKANGRPFRERQYILRVRGTGPWRTLILPRWASAAKAEVQATGDGMLHFRIGVGEEGMLTENGYGFRSRLQTAVATFQAEPVEAYGVTILGGPAEVSVTMDRARISIHGAAGRRQFRIPGEWAIRTPLVESADGMLTVDYKGGTPLQVVLEPRR